MDTPPSDHSGETVQEESKPAAGPSAGDNGIILPKSNKVHAEGDSDVSITAKFDAVKLV